jgi:undecaprenyl diphosphate synthase
MSENRLRNLAIIMDGNGRWAQKRGHARTYGHKKGVDSVRSITEYCSNHDEIESLTLYAFSTENWKRPKMEVDFLMRLLEKYIRSEQDTYMKHGVRFKYIGDASRFSGKLIKILKETSELTRNNTKLIQILALNYGGRDEIVRAASRLAKEGREISENGISDMLDTPYSDIDLLIRTGGERRLSNFLLWQASYAELFFTDTLWPDFGSEELASILKSYKRIQRKFGGV